MYAPWVEDVHSVSEPRYAINAFSDWPTGTVIENGEYEIFIASTINLNLVGYSTTLVYP